MDYQIAMWAGAGLAAGAVNAAATESRHLLLQLVRPAPGRRIVRLGLVANLLVGACTALVASRVVAIAGSCQADGTTATALATVALGFFIALATVRLVTYAADERLLRSAISKAAAAPAVDPDTVRRIELSPPHMIYTIADALMPRHYRPR